MTNTYAPILLFVYNRPEHVRRNIQALLKNELAAESELFIYSDAAKDETSQAAVKEVRAFIRSIQGFKKITITERAENWGLARSIIDGVTTQINRYGRVIVLEDDLVVAPHFLQFGGQLDIAVPAAQQEDFFVRKLPGYRLCVPAEGRLALVVGAHPVVEDGGAVAGEGGIFAIGHAPYPIGLMKGPGHGVHVDVPAKEEGLKL